MVIINTRVIVFFYVVLIHKQSQKLILEFFVDRRFSIIRPVVTLLVTFIPKSTTYPGKHIPLGYQNEIYFKQSI